ncbi:sialidase family protein [Prosthecobacter sp.]|uniref:sialidase family protein n=1 Tax=Prosthecobacter sp. TaxID=1965333 RepID=UPI00378502CF
MNRLFIFLFFLVLPLAAQVRPLAQEHVVIWSSPDPARLYGYTPGICRLPSGRLVVTHEVSSAGKAVTPEKKAFHESRILTSDDGGRTWTHRANFELSFGRPFVAGKSLYILGRSKQVGIVRSDDEGMTWSERRSLNDEGNWHQSACNVLFAKGNVYLVMEKHAPKRGIQGWQVADLAPVLMRARADADLTERKSWAFASELVFEDVPETQLPNAFGLPFYPVDRKKMTYLVPPKGRGIAPLGWLETNVVQFTDPDHVWCDPEGKTFHLWMRAHTGMTNYAAIAQVKENDDGSMTTSVVKTPAGTPMLYVPCPGGQMRFHVEWDAKTKLYWLLSSQATDSMTRPDRLAKERWGLPDNERQRLVLHFSKNMIDWCFAGLVCKGETPKESRHYASMCIDGEDLCIVSRSGDEKAHSAHNGNLITFHRVTGFRGLVY